jgi:hypothetical protein
MIHRTRLPHLSENPPSPLVSLIPILTDRLVASVVHASPEGSGLAVRHQ